MDTRRTHPNVEGFTGMSFLMKKLATAKRVHQQHGPRGIAAALAEKPADWWRALDRQVRGEGLWDNNISHRCQGRLVEILGNTVNIEGCKFSVDSPAIPTHIKAHVASKNYEAPERAILKRFLNPDLPVIEFGGSIGVVSCLTNKRLHNPDRHVVVEANPDLVPLLEKNRDLNSCQFRVLPRAVAYGSDVITFYRSAFFLASNLHNAWGDLPENAVRVPTTNLQNIVEEFGYERVTLICDIEGGEFDLVQHESDVLIERVEDFMVEVHAQLGDEPVMNMFDKLERTGFRHVYDEAGTYMFRNSKLN